MVLQRTRASGADEIFCCLARNRFVPARRQQLNRTRKGRKGSQCAVFSRAARLRTPFPRGVAGDVSGQGRPVQDLVGVICWYAQTQTRHWALRAKQQGQISTKTGAADVCWDAKRGGSNVTGSDSAGRNTGNAGHQPVIRGHRLREKLPYGEVFYPPLTAPVARKVKGETVKAVSRQLPRQTNIVRVLRPTPTVDEQYGTARQACSSKG